MTIYANDTHILAKNTKMMPTIFAFWTALTINKMQEIENRENEVISDLRRPMESINKTPKISAGISDVVVIIIC